MLVLRIILKDRLAGGEFLSGMHETLRALIGKAHISTRHAGERVMAR
jgi:hypothetical protein